MRLSALSCCFALLPALACAEGFDKSKVTLEAGLSTLGAYAAPMYEMNDRLTARMPLYFGALDDTFDSDGTSINGTFKASSGGFVADYAPWGNGAFISGGLLMGGYKIEGTTSAIATDLGSVAGNFGVLIKQKSAIAPVVSMGYRHETRFGMTAGIELGAKLVKHEMSVSGLDQLSGADLAQVQAQIDQTNADLDDVPAVGFLNLSLGFAF